jgi:hypothetical protein
VLATAAVIHSTHGTGAGRPPQPCASPREPIFAPTRARAETRRGGGVCVNRSAASGGRSAEAAVPRPWSRGHCVRITQRMFGAWRCRLLRLPAPNDRRHAAPAAGRRATQPEGAAGVLCARKIPAWAPAWPPPRARAAPGWRAPAPRPAASRPITGPANPPLAQRPFGLVALPSSPRRGPSSAPKPPGGRYTRRGQAGARGAPGAQARCATAGRPRPFIERAWIQPRRIVHSLGLCPVGVPAACDLGHALVYRPMLGATHDSRSTG